MARRLGKCAAPDCERDAVARGICLKHYKRWRAGRRIDDPTTKTSNPHLANYVRVDKSATVCQVEGCDGAVLSRGLCGSHYGRLKRHGDPLGGGPLREVRPGWKAGWSKHPLYATWAGMRARCNSPVCKAYPNYGARGITIDARWDDFRVFMEDMGERPEGTSLDRIDNDGPYSPENCRWATVLEQAANKRPMIETLRVDDVVGAGRSIGLCDEDLTRLLVLARSGACRVERTEAAQVACG